MTSFPQLGDPACPACLCEHHEAAYAETPVATMANSYWSVVREYLNGVTIVSAPITITERCCIAVNAATIIDSSEQPSALEIERPLGTIRTTQEDEITCNELRLLHHAAWEVLDPGTYTYYLVNRRGWEIYLHAAWLKIIASDCEG